MEMTSATIEQCSLQTPNPKVEKRPSQMENTIARKLTQVPKGYLVVR
jgi:hypothetical protein